MKRAVILLFIVSVFCIGIYSFLTSKSRNEFADGEEVKDTRILAIEINTETMRCEKETLESFLKLNGAGKLPPGGGEDYASFKAAFDRCSARLDELEQRLDNLKITSPALLKLKAASGTLISYQRALAGSKKFCADWIALSYGTPEEVACAGQGTDALTKDFHETLKVSRGLDRLIAKPGGAWSGALNLFYGEQIKPRETSPEKPNIIFILIDALRGDEVFRDDENNEPVMPFLRKLSAEGVYYENAFAPAATTLIVIPSIFTGLNPVDAGSASGSESWYSSKSLIPNFEKMGYFTAAFSANSLISPEYNFSPGFSSFRVRNWLPAGVVLPEAYSQLKYRLDGNPFLLYIHLIDTHDPYFPPADSGAQSNIELSDSMIADPNILRTKYVRQGIDPREHIPDENISYLRKLYDSEASYADGEIKKFFENLEKSGYLKNTLVVITADHGEAFLEHGDVKHSLQFYDEYLRVPLILWGAMPGDLKPGSRESGVRSTTEIFPSILKLVKGEVPADVERRSFLFSDGNEKRSAFAAGGGLALDRSELGHRLYAVRDADFKLIYDIKADTYALFNVTKDPGETNDLSARETKVFSEMKDALFKEFHLDEPKEKPVEKEPSPKLQKELKDLGYIR